jgi:hypothetical protein
MFASSFRMRIRTAVRWLRSFPVILLKRVMPSGWTSRGSEAGLFGQGKRPHIIYHFRYKTLDIWGATARILKQLLEMAYGFQPDAKQLRE